MDRPGLGKNTLRSAAKYLYKSATLHGMYPALYRKLVRSRPVQEKKAVFLEEYGTSLADNERMICDALQKQGGWQTVKIFLQRGKVSAPVFHQNCMEAVRQMADARCVFLDESSELVSCLPLRPETTVVQLWHACGAFKKFGYSLEGKRYGAGARELERFPRHRNFSYVTVSSPEVAWAYEEAFHMQEHPERIVPTGIARTDVYFRKDAFDAARQKLEQYVSGYVSGEKQETRAANSGERRRIVLYAPTFRGNVSDAVSPDSLDFDLLHRMLGPGWLFLVKHHPFVKHRPEILPEQAEWLKDLSDLMEIDELMMVSDVCISDYSSLVFEYSLLERPIVYYVPDLEEYVDWRGFYYPFEEITPGPVLTTSREVGEWLLGMEQNFDRDSVRAFREKYMSACDGHATERILSLI